MKKKKEIITIQIDYEIKYESEEHRQKAISSIIRDPASDSITGGWYGIRRLNKTVRVVETPERKQQ